MDDEKKTVGTETVIAVVGLLLWSGGLCYWLGHESGVKHARKVMLNTLNHAIEKGEIIISVEPVGSITEKWFQIISLPGKPSDVIPVGKGWTV